MPSTAIDVINDLISTCRDSQEGYSKAAKGVHSDSLRRLLMDIFEERGQFVEQLQALSESPADRPHGGGPLHRGWSDLEQRIRPKSDSELIDNCLDGDTGSITHYEHALESGVLKPQARSVVESQLTRVRATLDRIRAHR